MNKRDFRSWAARRFRMALLVLMVLGLLLFGVAAQAPEEGGPIIDGVDTALVVVAIIGLAKTIERIVSHFSGKALPEHTWASAHVILSALFAFLAAILAALPGIGLSLGPLFTQSIQIMDTLRAFLTFLITSGVIYWVARGTNVPLFGYSKSRAPNTS